MADPILRNTDCLDLDVDPTQGKLVAIPRLSASLTSTLQARPNGLYAAQLRRERCELYVPGLPVGAETPDTTQVQNDPVAITWEVEGVDTDAMFDPASPTLVTVPTTGLWAVSLLAQGWSSDTIALASTAARAWIELLDAGATAERLAQRTMWRGDIAGASDLREIPSAAMGITRQLNAGQQLRGMTQSLVGGIHSARFNLVRFR